MKSPDLPILLSIFFTFVYLVYNAVNNFFLLAVFLSPQHMSIMSSCVMLSELAIAVVIGLAFVVGLAVFIVGVAIIQRQVQYRLCVYIYRVPQ